MGAIWTDENKYRCWLQVEAAASTVLAEDGVIPAAAAEAIATKATVSAARVAEIEAEVKHDVIAFTTAVAESLKGQGLDAESRWLHYGLTSNDIVDTAQALQIKEASALIRDGIAASAGGAQAPRHRVQAHAHHRPHPWHSRGADDLRPQAAQLVRRDGAQCHALCRRRRGHARGQALRRRWHLRPSEARSTKSASARGWDSSPRPWPRRSSSATVTPPTSPRSPSSAARSTRLPSKSATCSAPRCARRRSTSAKSKKAPRPCRTRRIPSRASKSAASRACFAATAQAAMENIPLWHERDISHSSVERVIFPDSTILVDYLLAKTTDLIDRLLVYPERMKKNLESTGGLIFSGQLLLDLAEAGMLREDAYRLVQSHAMRAWKEDLNFREEVARDPAITKLLSPEKLATDLRLHAAAGQCRRDLQARAGGIDAACRVGQQRPCCSWSLAGHIVLMLRALQEREARTEPVLPGQRETRHLSMRNRSSDLLLDALLETKEAPADDVRA